MNRREFVVAACALVAAWITGQRMDWRTLFAAPRDSDALIFAVDMPWPGARAQFGTADGLQVTRYGPGVPTVTGRVVAVGEDSIAIAWPEWVDA